MSANLLDGITPTLMSGTTSESDGVWHNAGRTSTDGHDDWLVWDLAGQSALATNQTYHVGLSVKGATSNSMYLKPTIGYEDAAGNKNWAVPNACAVGTSWTRDEATIVIPSGMTPFAFYVAAYGTCPETWMAAPTLSYGSPVTLASSAHTPYATQDHVTAELNGMRRTVAPTEDTGTASRNYAVGEFFYDASHNLCRVTQAVSQGASLVSGTNYTTVSGGVQQYIGTPTYVYATAPSEATVKAAHATPCFVYVVDTASFYYVS